MFYNDPKAIDGYFESRVGQLFEKSQDCSHVELHIQHPSHKIDEETQRSLDVLMRAPDWNPEVESDSNSEPSSPIDQLHCSGEPPRYIGAPVLCKKISDVKSLTAIAAVGVLAVLQSYHRLRRLPNIGVSTVLPNLVAKPYVQRDDSVTY